MPGLRPNAIASADFDDDGRYDLVASGGSAWVITNDSPAGFRRGDGNGDGHVSAADLTALVLEVGDTDGHRVEDIRRADPNTSGGIDANGDGVVDVTDTRAVLLRMFRVS